MLAEVFAYALHAARLRAISLVCKRWRTAALRAIKSLRFDVTCSSEKMMSALSLLPSVTELVMGCEVPFSALPITLRELSLFFCFLNASLAEEARGGTTVLSMHFPNLTALKLEVLPRPGTPLLSLVRFVQAHSAQITSLSLDLLVVHESIKCDILALPWPKLRKLTCDAPLLNLWCPSPALVDVNIRNVSPDQFLAVPEEFLTRLTSVTITGNQIAQPVLDRFRRCPALKSLTTQKFLTDLECLNRNIDFFCHFLTGYEGSNINWEWLCQFKALRDLHVSQPCSLPPASLHLPLLQKVVIGDYTTRFPAIDALVFAMRLLFTCPAIKFVGVTLAGEAEDIVAPELVQCTEELIARSISQSVEYLMVFTRLPLHCEIPQAVQAGWLKLHLPPVSLLK